MSSEYVTLLVSDDPHPAEFVANAINQNFPKMKLYDFEDEQHALLSEGFNDPNADEAVDTIVSVIVTQVDELVKLGEVGDRGIMIVLLRPRRYMLLPAIVVRTIESLHFLGMSDMLDSLQLRFYGVEKDASPAGIQFSPFPECEPSYMEFEQ